MCSSYMLLVLYFVYWVRQLPEHVRRVAMEAASSDDDSDDENDSNAKVAAGWGKKR